MGSKLLWTLAALGVAGFGVSTLKVGLLQSQPQTPRRIERQFVQEPAPKSEPLEQIILANVTYEQACAQKEYRQAYLEQRAKELGISPTVACITYDPDKSLLFDSMIAEQEVKIVYMGGIPNNFRLSITRTPWLQLDLLLRNEFKPDRPISAYLPVLDFAKQQQAKIYVSEEGFSGGTGEAALKPLIAYALQTAQDMHAGIDFGKGFAIDYFAGLLLNSDNVRILKPVLALRAEGAKIRYLKKSGSSVPNSAVEDYRAAIESVKQLRVFVPAYVGGRHLGTLVDLVTAALRVDPELQEYAAGK